MFQPKDKAQFAAARRGLYAAKAEARQRRVPMGRGQLGMPQGIQEMH
jgi:hypothetical protein